MSPIGVGVGQYPGGAGALNPFIWRLTSPVYWMPSVAVPALPTSAEIASSIDLKPVLIAVSGFRVEQQRKEYADVQLGAMVQRRGSVKFSSASALAFREDLLDQTIRTELVEGLSGYVGFMPYGRVPGRRMEVWPVESMVPMMDDNWSLGTNEPASFVVPFVITALPELDAVVPA